MNPAAAAGVGKRTLNSSTSSDMETTERSDPPPLRVRSDLEFPARPRSNRRRQLQKDSSALRTPSASDTNKGRVPDNLGNMKELLKSSEDAGTPSLNNEVDKLRQERDEYRESVQRYKAKLNKQGQELLSLKALTEEDPRATADRRELRRQLEEAQSGLLKMEADHAAGTMELTNRLAGLEKEVTDLRGVDALKKRLEEEKTDLMANVVAQKGTIETFRQTLAEAGAQTEKERKELLGKYQRQLERLQDDLNSKTAELDECRKQSDHVAETANALQKAQVKQAMQLGQLQDELKRKNAELSKCRKQGEDVAETAKTVQAKQAEQLGRLQDDLTRKTTDLDECRKQNDRAAEAADALQKAQAKEAEDTNSKHMVQIKTLEEQLRESQTAAKQTKETLRQVQDSYEAGRDFVGAQQLQINRLQEDLKSKTTELEEFRRQSDEAAETANGHQKAQAKEAEDANSKHLLQIKDLEERLRESVATAKETKEALRQMQDNHEAASRALKASTRRETEADQHITRYRLVEDDKIRMEHAHKDSVQKLREQEETALEELSVKTELGRDNFHLTAEISEVKKAMEEYARKIESLTCRENELRHKADLLRMQLTQQEKATKEAVDERDRVHTRTAEQAQRLHDKEDEARRAEMTIQGLREKLAEFEERFATLEDALSSLREAYADC